MNEVNTEAAEAAKAPAAKAPSKKEDGKLFGQISKFAVVGVLNTVIDLGIVNVMVLVFKLNPVMSNVVGVSAAITNSYILNKKWTFQDKGKNVAGQFGIFVLLSIIGLIINTSVFIFLFQKWTL